MEKKHIKSENLSIAPCKAACPAGIDVPRYIRHIRRGEFGEALAVIREKIPFPAICGYACYSPCELTCTNQYFGDPIAIRALKRTAAEMGDELWKKGDSGDWGKDSARYKGRGLERSPDHDCMDFFQYPVLVHHA